MPLFHHRRRSSSNSREPPTTDPSSDAPAAPSTTDNNHDPSPTPASPPPPDHASRPVVTDSPTSSSPTSGGVSGGASGLFRRLSSRARRRSGSGERGGSGSGSAAVDGHEAGRRGSGFMGTEKEQQSSTADHPKPQPQKDPNALTRDDVRALFSGAPHFILEAGHRHRFFPQAFFPYASDLDVTDLQDRVPLSHESFALATLHSHLPVPTLGETGAAVRTFGGGYSPHRDDGGGGTDPVTRETDLHSSSALDSPSSSSSAAAAAPPPPQQTTTIPPSLQPNRRPMFDLSIYERPNMLSIHGIEPGTFGFHAFLERGVADGLESDYGHHHQRDSRRRSSSQRDDDDDDKMASAQSQEGAMSHAPSSEPAAADTPKIGKHAPPVDRRALLREGPTAWKRVGVRPISLRTVTERLGAINELRNEVVSKGWHYTVLQKWGDAELGRYLFQELLCEDLLFERSSSSTSSASPHTAEDKSRGKGGESSDAGTALKKQIEILVKVLTTPGAWLDFSLPRERLLFVMSLHTRDVSVDVNTQADGNATDVDEQGITSASKRWLSLVQLLLAVELVIRLDAALRLGVAMHSHEVDVSSAEIHRFNRLRTLKVDWDLVVARRFLDLCYVKQMPIPPGSNSHLPQNPEQDEDWPYDCAVLPRKPDMMIDGLVRFARDIGWDAASIDEMSAELNRKLRAGDKPYEEREATLARGIEALDHPHVPRHTRDRSTVELRAAGHDTIGGPLTHAWIRGPIFPGYISCDLLMCALLENDTRQQAVRRLGHVGYPRCGFVLGSRSWWSKLCVLAGVLAPAPGTAERMGWVGLPQGLAPLDPESGDRLPDGWRRVVSKPLVGQEGGGGRQQQRIFDGEDVAKQSSTLGVGKGHVLASEFDMVTDRDLDVAATGAAAGVNGGSSGSLLHVSEVQLVLQPQDEESSDSEEKGYEAAVLANIREDEAATAKSQVVLMPLRYTVRFVAAHPCRPPPGHVKAQQTAGGGQGHGPLSPDESQPHAAQLRHKGHECLPSHPLHRSFKHVVRSIAEVLAVDADDEHALPLLPSPTGTSTSTSGGAGSGGDVDEGGTAGRPPIWIIDARGGWEREVLVRAWCAKVGHHAIVSRVGVACVGCSVREARAVNVAVVIRVTR